MPSNRIAVVTGANKGIGLAIVRQLALLYPSSPLASGPLVIYLTARSVERGRAAVKLLQDDSALRRAKALAHDGGLTTIVFTQLDISRIGSIRAFRGFLRKMHPGGIDFLINNAGIAPQGIDLDVAIPIMETNYYGTLNMVQQLLPLIRPAGRVVNIADRSGHLTAEYSEGVRLRLTVASQVGVSQISGVMEEFKAAVVRGMYDREWPRSAYAVSKAGVIAFTKLIAEEHSVDGKEILINSCCPGWVMTDLTKGQGRLSPDQGAMTPVLLALGDIRTSSGQFFHEGNVIRW